MRIEFVGDCTLEIAHMGTPAEIHLQQASEFCDTLVAAFVNAGKRIAEALSPVLDEMQRRSEEILVLWKSMPNGRM